ncbi:MAG: hypothetical protein HYT77_02260 [Deltaproteobacteria bacterium]|nr:hypothetical protein [Deltaproteobacteria bacterium]
MSRAKSPPISYEGALAIAKRELRLLDHLSDVAMGHDFIPKSLVYLNDDTLDRDEALRKAAEIELENAMKTKSAYSFDNACELVANLVERGKPLSGKLAQWAASILRSHEGWASLSDGKRIKRPRQHGPAPQKNYFRNEAIIEAIDALRKKGLTPGRKLDRGRPHSSESLCAFDVVKSALAGQGVTLGDKAIETIWHSRPRASRRSSPLTK